MSFASLIEAVGLLQKSQSLDTQDDKKIAGAAGGDGAGAGVGGDDDGAGAGAGGEGAEGGEGGEGAGAGDGDGDGDGDVDESQLTKSFTFTLEDGTQVEALDGAQMLKSFGEKLAAADQRAIDAGAAAAAAAESAAAIEAGVQELMQKSLEVIANQGTLIKSLQEKVDRLAAEPRGRRTVSTVAEVPAAMRKSLSSDDRASQGVPPVEFMAKCLDAQRAGRVTALDSARAEAAIQNGVAVPQDIVSRVLV